MGAKSGGVLNPSSVGVVLYPENCQNICMSEKEYRVGYLFLLMKGFCPLHECSEE